MTTSTCVLGFLSFRQQSPIDSLWRSDYHYLQCGDVVAEVGIHARFEQAGEKSVRPQA